MTDPTEDDSAAPASEELGAALMLMNDMFSGFADLAVGARKQLIEGGFSQESADAIASEFIVEGIRMAFAAAGKKAAKPPSLLDFLRRPPSE